MGSEAQTGAPREVRQVLCGLWALGMENYWLAARRSSAMPKRQCCPESERHGGQRRRGARSQGITPANQTEKPEEPKERDERIRTLAPPGSGSVVPREHSPLP